MFASQRNKTHNTLTISFFAFFHIVDFHFLRCCICTFVIVSWNYVIVLVETYVIYCIYGRALVVLQKATKTTWLSYAQFKYGLFFLYNYIVKEGSIYRGLLCLIGVLQNACRADSIVLTLWLFRCIFVSVVSHAPGSRKKQIYLEIFKSLARILFLILLYKQIIAKIVTMITEMTNNTPRKRFDQNAGAGIKISNIVKPFGEFCILGLKITEPQIEQYVYVHVHNSEWKKVIVILVKLNRMLVFKQYYYNWINK